MIKTAVIGYPIKHSKSPIIHRHWMDTHNTNGTFEAIKILPENLARDVRRLIENGYTGFSVTIPHKQAIMDMCDEIDDTARTIGAVNMIAVREGRIFGSNTDAFGFTQNIKHSAPQFVFHGKAAVVLGAGGAARAIVYGLLSEGISPVILTNRTRSKAEQIADDMRTLGMIEVCDWDDRSEIFKNADILVNTTPLGMAGFTALDVDFTTLPKTTLVTDVIYTPLLTDLLMQAQNRGNPIVTGIGMLLHQARPAFKAWTDIDPTVDGALEKLVLS